MMNDGLFIKSRVKYFSNDFSSSFFFPFQKVLLFFLDQKNKKQKTRNPKYKKRESSSSNRLGPFHKRPKEARAHKNTSSSSSSHVVFLALHPSGNIRAHRRVLRRRGRGKRDEVPVLPRQEQAMAVHVLGERMCVFFVRFVRSFVG